jgi:protoporphyrinogen oxidase
MTTSLPQSDSQRIAVVGGGMLGLVLAYRLAQRGQRVALFEAADHLGGLADPWQLGDVTWDRHYHVTLLSDHYLRSLLAELGLDEKIRWVETRTGFFTGGRWHSMSSTWEFLRFPPLGLLDKFRLGLTIWQAARRRDWKRLENLSVEAWLRRWSGSRTFEKIWLPLLRAKLGENYRRTSAAFIWATIARMYAARRTGLKKEMFGYVPGGYAAILDRFADELHRLGVEIHPSTPVAAVEHSSDRRPQLKLAGGPRAFDRVVLTVPAPHVARLCRGLTADEHRRFAGIDYQGIVCASALLKRPLKGYYVTNITDAGLPFTAVIEMTALVDPQQFGGRHLVYLPKYVPADDPAFGLSDDEIRAQFLDGLRQMVPDLRPEQVLSFRISRVRNVMPLPTLGYSDRLPPVSTSLPGVYAVNSAHIVNGTLNVNETVRLAEEALPQVLSHHPNTTADLETGSFDHAETNRQLVARP